MDDSELATAYSSDAILRICDNEQKIRRCMCVNGGERQCVCCKEEITFCLRGNRFTGVLKAGISVALKGSVINTASYNKWALKFESWRSQVAVEESFPHNVLLTDDPNLLYSAFKNMLVILLIVTNGRLIILRGNVVRPTKDQRIISLHDHYLFIAFLFWFALFLLGFSKITNVLPMWRLHYRSRPFIKILTGLRDLTRSSLGL